MDHTFKVFVTIEMNMTFDDTSVEIDPDSGHVEPSESALDALSMEVQTLLREEYVVHQVAAESDSAMLVSSTE